MGRATDRGYRSRRVGRPSGAIWGILGRCAAHRRRRAHVERSPRRAGIVSATPGPPFRADQVGSLLRPAELKEARTKVERGELAADALRAVEDHCIREAAAKQEAIGLESVTDGEFRRGWWNHDFLGKIDGVQIVLDPGSPKFVGSDDPRYTPQVRRKVRRARPLMVDHFRYLRSVARKTPKFCIPSPSILYHRGGRAAISKEAYPDLAELWADVGQVYREELDDSPPPAAATSRSTTRASLSCATKNFARAASPAATTRPSCRTCTRGR